MTSSDMSAVYMNKLDISCTWKTANERSIKHAITFGNVGDGISELDIYELVSFETCVQLINPCSSASTPMLNFNFKSDYNISAIKIISEARIIELYGRGGEYITTSHSEFVDDFEGMAVYSALLKLNIPSSECSLKFNKLKSLDNFWLYGVGIYIETCQDIECSQVNLKSITDRLQLSGCNLSGNAEQCLRLLRGFQAGVSDEKKRPDISRLPEDIAQKPEIEDTSRKMCELLLSMSPALANLKGLKTFRSPSPQPLPHIADPFPVSAQESVRDYTMCDIRTVLDEQFQKLETNLMAKVDSRLNKVEEKLDLLMAMLRTNSMSLGSEEEIEAGQGDRHGTLSKPYL